MDNTAAARMSRTSAPNTGKHAGLQVRNDHPELLHLRKVVTLTVGSIQQSVKSIYCEVLKLLFAITGAQCY